MAGDTQEVPAAAADRLRRLTDSGGRTSLVSTAAAAGLGSVGLAPVSEVMGAVGQQIPWQGGVGGSAQTGRPRTVVAGQGRSPGGALRPYVDAIQRGYRIALARLTAEVAAVQGDGAVGVRLTVTVRDSGFYEFLAVGTAVRARTSRRLSRPFLTDLPGADVAKLMGYGWVPVTIAIGVSVATRVGEDPRLAAAITPQQNFEVTGYSDMMTRARADARRRFRQEVRVAGADGALVSTITVRRRGMTAEARVIGTAIAQFAATPPVRPAQLGVLPLSSSRERGNR